MRFLAVAVCVLFSGCAIGDMVNVPEEDARLDSNAAAIANAYKSYVAINTAPYGSALGAFDVDVFVTAAGASEYAKIDPVTVGSEAEIPVGTVIVRQVFAAGSTTTIDKLTIMVKGPEGYDPTLGDWWFAVTDTKGNALPDVSGNPQIGRLSDCHSCHIPRAADGYLFGVPAAMK